MDKLLKNKKINLYVTIILLVIALGIIILSGIIFSNFSNYDTYFYVRDDITIEKFSDYSPSLKGTAGDANIYCLNSGVEGPSLLILGGTHPNEPSGQLTATLFLENLKVTKGKVYVITETNKSAYTHSQPQEASPFYYTLTTASGQTRTFKFGSRATNTNQQWPNPDVYVHSPSGQKLSSSETRNINRAYPGSIDGTYTERVAYAVTELIRQNDITMTIDLHEASPEYITINAIVAHERAKIVASKAVYDMDDNDVKINLEISPNNFHGLTHRELGDHTNTLAFLCETSNASQGKIRGAFIPELITSGEDKFYKKAEDLGLLYAAPTTIEERVARHTISIISIINAYNFELLKSKPFSLETEERSAELIQLGKLEISSIPTYNDILDNGVGYYLHDPE